MHTNEATARNSLSGGSVPPRPSFHHREPFFSSGGESVVVVVVVSFVLLSFTVADEVCLTELVLFSTVRLQPTSNCDRRHWTKRLLRNIRPSQEMFEKILLVLGGRSPTQGTVPVDYHVGGGEISELTGQILLVVQHSKESSSTQYESRSDIVHRQNLNIEERRRKRLPCECLGNLQDEHADEWRNELLTTLISWETNDWSKTRTKPWPSWVMMSFALKATAIL